MRKQSYMERSITYVGNIADRMRAVGLMAARERIEIMENEDGFYLAYLNRDGEVRRTSGSIGPAPRDLFMYVRGLASATFTLTEDAYMSAGRS